MSNVIKFAEMVQTARMNAVRSLIDGAVQAGVLKIYSGDAPNSADEALTAQNHELVTLVLPKPCGTVTSGVLSFGAIDEQMVLTSGLATFARLYDGSGKTIADLSVSLPSGDGAIKLVVVDLLAGGILRVVSAKFK